MVASKLNTKARTSPPPERVAHDLELSLRVGPGILRDHGHRRRALIDTNTRRCAQIQPFDLSWTPFGVVATGTLDSQAQRVARATVIMKLNDGGISSSLPIRHALPESPELTYPWSTSQVHPTPPRLFPGRRVGTSSNPSPSPFPRHGHSMTATATAAGEFLVSGGSKNASSTNDIYSFSPSDASVTLLQTAGDAPSRRVGHGSVLVNKVLIVWGGDTRTDIGINAILDGGLYMLNLITSEWSRIVIRGPSPRGRYGHTMSHIKTKLYVFGGQADNFFMNDVWVFDLLSLGRKARWELVNMGPASDLVGPPRRAGHSSVTVGGQIYIFGGRESEFCYNDTWCFDTDKRRWTKLKCVGSLPSAREGHAAAVVNDVMYVFGGKGIDGSCLGDLVALHITQRRWYTFEDLGPAPSARWGHAMAMLGTRIFLLGGAPSASGDNEDTNENGIHVLDTGVLSYPMPSSSTKVTEPSSAGEAM